MQEQAKMSKIELLDTLRSAFNRLKLDPDSKGEYTPDPAKLSAMAESIRLRAESDPTILGGQTFEDLR